MLLAHQVVGIFMTFYPTGRHAFRDHPDVCSDNAENREPAQYTPTKMPRRLENAGNLLSNLIIELVVVTHFHQTWPPLRLRQASGHGFLLAFAFVPVMGAIELGRQLRCCGIFALF